MRFCVCCAMLLSGVESAVAGPPLLVREHADLSRLVIEGNETFTADDIRKTLERNLELLALRRRLAPYREFEAALQRLIRDGYRHLGFPDVVVEVTFDEERDAVVVTIQEGTRYEYGDVAVSGVSDELAALIRRRLTAPHIAIEEVVVGVHDEETGDLLYGFNAEGEHVEETETVWKPGKPADFHQQPEKQFLEPVTQALRDAGFAGAEVSVQLVPSADANLARLEVDVLNPGAPIVIDDVVVTGAERNSTESVLEFLELETPIHWTPELPRTLNQKLWDCGRFQTFSVKLETSEQESGDAGTRLLIDLLEYDAVPLLTEELSEVDQILCRVAHWFSTEAGRSVDLVVVGEDEREIKGPEEGQAFSIPRLHAVVSPGHGVFVDVDWMLPGDREPRSLTVAMEPDRWFALSGQTGRRLEYEFEKPLLLKFFLGLVGHQDPDSDAHTWMRFGYGFSSATQAEVRMRFAAAPMAMIYQARYQDPECQIADGVLSIQSDHMAAEFEAATGRWIRFAMLDPEIGSTIAEIRFEEHAFEEAMRRRFDAASDQPPVNSLSDFIAGELLAFASQKGVGESLVALTTFSTSLGGRLKERIDEAPPREEREESFGIPWMPSQPPPIPMEMLQIAHVGGALLFPRDSTFMTFNRELLLGLLMQDEQASANIERLIKSYSTGPLMYWYVAEVFRYLNPVLAQAIAREGQDRLDRRRFETDCRQLLTRDDIVRDVIEDCIATLREMDDAQLDALFSLAAGPEQRAAMIAALRRDGSSDLDVLLSLLGELWDAKLRDLLRQRLIDLGGGPEIRNADRRLRGGFSVAETASAESRRPLSRVRYSERSHAGRASQGSSLDPQGRRR